MPTISEARERRLREWREWSQRTGQVRPRKEKIPNVLPADSGECLQRIATIVEICRRAGLDRAALYLDGCRQFVEQKLRDGATGN